MIDTLNELHFRVTDRDVFEYVVKPTVAAPSTIAIDLPAKSGTLRVGTFKMYRALLSQTGTAAPTAIVLENDFAAPIVWTRTGAGLYTGTLAGVFLTGKVFPRAQSIGSDSSTAVYMGIGRATDDTVVLGTGVVGAANSDAKLNNSPVEIIVYS